MTKVEHSHVTRVIVREGTGCPACDQYHANTRAKAWRTYVSALGDLKREVDREINAVTDNLPPRTEFIVARERASAARVAYLIGRRP